MCPAKEYVLTQVTDDCSVFIVIVSTIVPNCSVMSVSQVIFEHEGVFIHPSSDEDGVEQDLLISGTLRIVDKVTVLSLVSWPYTVIPETCQTKLRKY